MLMWSKIGRREFLQTASGATLAAQSTPGRLQAGTAKIDITPDRPRICASGDKPDPPAAYARLHSRILTVSDGVRRIVFVNYDLNCLDVATPILRERAERELGISPPYLILLATHNHQGPIQIAGENFDYGRELAEKIFAGIREAIASEAGPCELFFGNGYGYFTRAQRSDPPDYEIQLLQVRRGGRVAALLFNHPTHPQLGPRKLYGASHPGFAMEALEQKFPGAVALYADACGGNQYTLAPSGTVDLLEACKARGHELAQSVLNIVKGELTEVSGPIESRLTLVDLPLADPVPYARALELARDVTDEEFLVKELAAPRKYPCRFVEVVGARIGRLTLVAIQGEPLAPIGMRIKEVLRQRGPAMVFGYFAEHNLYIPTRENVRLDLYQAQALRVQYTCPVGWALSVEEEMLKGALAAAAAEPWIDPREQRAYPLRRQEG
jgi:neutral ceramidase